MTLGGGFKISLDFLLLKLTNPQIDGLKTTFPLGPFQPSFSGFLLLVSGSVPLAICAKTSHQIVIQVWQLFSG